MPSEYETRSEELCAYIRENVEEFLAFPTGSLYHHLKNKLAEYYSISQVVADEKEAENQDTLRRELGIG